MRRMMLLSALALVAGLVGAVPDAMATHSNSTVLVDGSDSTADGSGCGDAANPCNTIQTGVDHATDGDTVRVAPGTYTEQVVVNKSVFLVGDGSPVIQAPTTPTTYTFPETGSSWDPVVFLVGGTVASGAVDGEGTVEASIDGFVVDGADRNPTADRSAGILLRNVSPGEVTGNTVQNMHVSDKQTFGIIAYGDSDAAISDNTVTEYSRGGIAASGDAGEAPDPVASIHDNTVAGPGTTAPGDWAPNGIQIGFGAGGSVASNVVTDHGFSGGDAGSGIIIFGASDGVEVTSNELARNELSILVSEDTFFGSGDSDGAVVRANEILDTVQDQDGIRISGSDAVTLTGNQVNGAGDDGIQIGNEATGAKLAGNSVSNSADDGLVATSSTSGNDFRGNKASGSGDLSCLDTSEGSGTAGTANTWHGNKGERASDPDEICR